MKDKCPCRDCICIPICRHKRFSIITDECSLAMDYRNDYTDRDDEDYFISIVQMEKILKPILWRYKINKQYIDQTKVMRSHNSRGVYV